MNIAIRNQLCFLQTFAAKEKANVSNDLGPADKMITTRDGINIIRFKVGSTNTYEERSLDNLLVDTFDIIVTGGDFPGDEGNIEHYSGAFYFVAQTAGPGVLYATNVGAPTAIITDDLSSFVIQDMAYDETADLLHLFGEEGVGNYRIRTYDAGDFFNYLGEINLNTRPSWGGEGAYGITISTSGIIDINRGTKLTSLSFATKLITESTTGWDFEESPFVSVDVKFFASSKEVGQGFFKYAKKVLFSLCPVPVVPSTETMYLHNYAGPVGTLPAAIDETSKRTITYTDNCEISAVTIGDGAVTSDPVAIVDEFLQTDASTELSIEGVDDFCIEGTLARDTATAPDIILKLTDSGTGTKGLFFKGGFAGLDLDMECDLIDESGTYTITAADALDIGNTMHFALVRQGTSLKMYIDGVLQATIVVPASLSFPTPEMQLTQYMSTDLGDTMRWESLRFVVDNPVHTTNFTPADPLVII